MMNPTSYDESNEPAQQQSSAPAATLSSPQLVLEFLSGEWFAFRVLVPFLANPVLSMRRMCLFLACRHHPQLYEEKEHQRSIQSIVST
jgi:hypothetical protein